MKPFKFIFISYLLTVLTACSAFDATQDSSVSQNIGASSSAAQSSQYTIDGLQFKKIQNDEVFTPHGVNYVRLADINGQKNWHANFDPETYDRERTRNDLRQIKQSGYNLVRVFISFQGISGTQNQRLNIEYLNNLKEFLSEARKLNLTVSLTSQWLPTSYYSVFEDYRQKLNVASVVEGVNTTVLDPAYVNAYGDFWVDLLAELNSYKDTIFSIDLWNEIYLDASQPPFDSDKSFHFKGRNYQFTSVAQRALFFKEATHFWANTLVEKIKERHPSVLISTSVFTPMAVQRSHQDFSGESDPRHPLKLEHLQETLLDYLDLHIYTSESPDADYNSAGVYSAHTLSKPLVIGEVGVYRSNQTQVAQAVASLSELLNQGCQRKVSGHIFWTWDSSPEQPHIWDLTEQGGALNGLFSPIFGPVCNHHQVSPSDSTHELPTEISEVAQSNQDDSDTLNQESGDMSSHLPQQDGNSVYLDVYRLYNPMTGTHRTGLRPVIGNYIWDQSGFMAAQRPFQDFNRPIYLCRQKGSLLYFNSIDSNCEGQMVIERLGFISPVETERATRALYRCYKGEQGHFTTTQVSECRDNNFGVETILGYVVW